MTWRLRRVLPTLFSLGFSDADPVFNHRLEEYESLQFLNPKQDELVVIEKTDVQGDPYDSVLFGDQRVNYPRPFVFSVAPVGGHPNYLGAARAARVLCMYDNAGESFLPGADTAASPVTRHLARSRVLMFLSTPRKTCDSANFAAARPATRRCWSDPSGSTGNGRCRQETILAEAAQRVRHFAGLGQNQRHRRPLVVIVTKFDAWLPLLTDALNGSSDHSESASALADALRTARGLPHPWATSSRSQVAALDLSVVETISRALRSLLWRVSPEIVSVAEGFAGEVVYIPVSATGRSPERDPRSGALGFRPRDVKPVWAEVPLLYSMSRWMQGLVPYRARPRAMRNRRDRARRGRIIARRAARTSLLTEDVERGIVSQELIYTSVPRGLKPGSNGFCTVACTRGMSANLVQQLESLSGYRHIYPPQDPQARLNPIAFSHLVIAVAGRNWHVLSRICDAGLDYTQRTNKFAHHVVLDAAETPAGGPAWLLAGSGFMRSTWEGEPCNFPSGPAIPAGQSPPRVCRAWQQLTGDAGWGGVLAETVAGPVGRQAVLVFPPGTDMLTLLAESLALLPAELRWRVTFSTYFTKLPPGIACQWRCVADGTPEAAAARRGPPTALVIDLCRPLGPAAGGTYVEAARTGRMPRAVPATAAGPAEIGLDLAFRTDAPAPAGGYWAAIAG